MYDDVNGWDCILRYRGMVFSKKNPGERFTSENARKEYCALCENVIPGHGRSRCSQFHAVR
jgi:hypothetical protein